MNVHIWTWITVNIKTAAEVKQQNILKGVFFCFCRHTAVLFGFPIVWEQDILPSLSAGMMSLDVEWKTFGGLIFQYNHNFSHMYV